MQIFKTIKEKFCSQKQKSNKDKATQLSEYYRKKVFNDEALEHLTAEDFQNLIYVSHYADMGILTAIEAAFCLGYRAGKGGTDNGI